MAYKYNEWKHSRQIRYNESLKQWQWCLYSLRSGKLLKVLTRAKDPRELYARIKEWKKIEAKREVGHEG